MPVPIVAMPLHTQLRSVLMRRITSGEWKAGMLLPNENDLAIEFNVSTGTVRKALGWLEDAEIVARQQGRGTFVKDQGAADLAARYLPLRSSDGAIVKGTVRSAAVSTGSAAPKEARKLNIETGQPVYRSVQLRIFDGLPVSWEHRVLPRDLFPELDPGTTIIESSGEFAALHGVYLGRGAECIGVEGASAEVADALETVVGAPIVVFDRVIDTVDGRRAEWRKAWCNLGTHIYEARLS